MDQRIGSNYRPSSYASLALHSSQYPYHTNHSQHPIGTLIIQPPTTLQYHQQKQQHQLQLPSSYYDQSRLKFASFADTITPPHVIQSSSRDEVRTLFIAGLPEDVKEREVYNLFRMYRGYESSHLRPPRKTSQPFAFAVFVDQASAVAAMQSLNGMVFDIERGSTLHIDLAKANSRSKRSRADDERRGSAKKARGLAKATSLSPDNGVGSVHSPGMSNFAHNTTGYPSAQSREGSPDDGLMNKDNFNMASNALIHQDNPPCATLFVANLGPQCTEQELSRVFSRCSGFLKLKMQRRQGSPVAFIDFLDTDSSTSAMNELQGTVLESSVHEEGMRLEFAKSRMGTRKWK